MLLTPATAAPPPRIGQLQGRGALWTLNTVAGWVPYNGVWNVTGQPAASVPAGFGADGPAAGRAARRSCQRRGDAAVARRPARGASVRGRSCARPSSRERPARVRRQRAAGGCAAGGCDRGRHERGRHAGRAGSPGRRAGGQHQEHAHRPRQRGRPGLRADDPRAARPPAPGRRLPGGGGRSHAGHQRAQLGGGPAGRHDQLPVRDPAVVRQRGGARRAGHDRRGCV